MTVGRPALTSRAKIIKAARRILQKEGIAGLSVRNVAAAVDTAPSTIYNYFGTKQGFMAALANEMLSGARPSIAPGKDPIESVRQWMLQYRELLLKTPELIVLAHASGPVASVFEIGSDLHDLLLSAGLSEKDAALHSLSLHYTVNGFVMQEIGQKSSGIDVLASAPEEHLARAKMTNQITPAQLFESTVDRNLEGLRVYIAKHPAKTKRQ
jgi:TetR/AcrR family tetracycline transcriptional repressor